MEGSKSYLYQQDASELFSMLESQDLQTVENVKALILENLGGTKDVRLIHGLLDYYIAVQSTCALDILVRIREPHDKHLFERMTEYLRKENTRYYCLLLLSHLIQRQPSWLFKITQHRAFQVLLNLLKNETDFPSLMCLLFSVITLLPMIPYQISCFLTDVFEIFSRLAALSTKKCGIPDVYILHLQVGIYALFHRLYGMYPCNFLGYLRSHYGGREYKEENIRIFTTIIRPMLEKVKLHPSLVTACKDSEVSQRRWKRMATHDIVSLCASVSLDPIEGMSDEKSNLFPNVMSVLQPSSSIQSQDNSIQCLSINSIGSTVSVGADSLISDVINIRPEVFWSPSQNCGLITPPPSTNLVQLSSSEYAEERCAESGFGVDNFSHESDVVDAENEEESRELLHEKNSELSVGEALEAKEEEELDNEVSEFTRNASPFSSYDTRVDTPFRSTTQNLTDKGDFISNSELFIKDKENSWRYIEFERAEQSIYQSNDFDSTAIQRLRYFSQCGMPPEINVKRIISRSSSVPNIKIGELVNECIFTSNGVSKITVPVSHQDDVALDISSNPFVQNASWHESESSQSMKSVETSYDHLIPLALQSLSLNKNDYEGTALLGSYKSAESTPFYCSLSPSDLLDRYVQLGSDAHTIQLGSIPLTSTQNANWTHFGGMPPADEIKLARTQVQLLHAQVMFERHRRETHAQRNRRLLGKIKQSRIQEEIVAALKDQLLLLEKEKVDTVKELKQWTSLYRLLDRKHKDLEINSNISLVKLSQENCNLLYSNKKLQTLLVTQKQENDLLKSELQFCQSEILAVQFELELMKSEVERSRKLDKENSFLAKQNILLQEMASEYKERVASADPPKLHDTEHELMKDAATAEIKGLKQQVESKMVTIDTLKARVASLEEEVSDMKLKCVHLSEISEQLKAVHKDEILAREERLSELKKIHQHELTHILELRCIMEKANINSDELKEEAMNIFPSEDDFSSNVNIFAGNGEFESFCINEFNEKSANYFSIMNDEPVNDICTESENDSDNMENS